MSLNEFLAHNPYCVANIEEHYFYECPHDPESGPLRCITPTAALLTTTIYGNYDDTEAMQAYVTALQQEQN